MIEEAAAGDEAMVAIGVKDNPRCTTRSAMSAVTNVRYHFDLQVQSRYFAANVLKNKVVVEEKEEETGDEILAATEMIDVKKDRDKIVLLKRIIILSGKWIL